MTLAQIAPDPHVEVNPYSPTVPESIRDISPDLYEHLRDLTSDLRQAHSRIQAGQPSNDWSQMLVVDLTQRYTLGSQGRFYHTQYGVLSGIYCQFAQMQTDGFLVSRNDTGWTVSNNFDKSVNGSILGLIAAVSVPPSGSYGWILTQGVNLNQLLVTGTKPSLSDYLARESDGTIQVDGTSFQVVGQLASANDLTQTDTGWEVGAGCVLIDTQGGLSEFAFARLAKTTVTSPSSGDSANDNSDDSFNFFEQNTNASIRALSDRIYKLTDDGAQIETTQSLSAMANFASLAGVAADNANYASRLSNVALAAANNFSQLAKAYRDEAGYYAESTIQLSVQATLQANNSQVSANASASHALDSQTSATAAGTSATASETSHQAAVVQANNALASATAAQTYSVTATQAASTATQQANLAASYAQQTANGNNTGFQQVNASIQNEAQVRAANDGALTNDYVNRDSQVLTNANQHTDSSVSNEATTRAQADQAEASARQQVQASLNQTNASVTYLETALATQAGGYAQATLTLDVNGHITGFQATNNGVTGSFTIIANNFTITDGTTAKSPFSISNGVVSMTNVVVDTLKVNTAIVPLHLYSTTAVQGNFNQTLLMSGTIHMDNPGIVEADGAVNQGFSAIPRSWNYYLFINGTQVWHPAGTYPGDSVPIGGSLACPAGDIQIALYANNDSAVTSNEYYLKIFGYPNTQ